MSGYGGRLRLFVCTDHAQHYPVGQASIVLATDPQQAMELLVDALREHGLKQVDKFTLIEFPLDAPARALVLRDGNY